MNILSLFDGMACGMLAMLAQGIEVERYVAYEIDKYAIKTSTHNFPMIEHRGDVFGADFTEFKGFDYVVGGSPCTYWSIAQKNNRETEASGMGWELFSQYVRAIKEAEPKYFIYENNKSMSNAIRESITNTFGFEPIMINSALLSAQNRQRLYWVGKRNADGTYSKVDVQMPEDKGILLRDVLDSGTAWREKSYCIDANYYKGGNFTSPKKQSDLRMMAAEPVPINTTEDGKKARTLMAGYYKYCTATLLTNKGFKGGTTAVSEPVRIPEYGSDNKRRPVTHSYSKQGCGQLDKNVFPTNPCKQLYDYICESVRIPPYGNEDKARPLNAYYSNNCGGFEHRMFSDNPNKQQTDMIAESVRVGCMPSPDGTIKGIQAKRVYSMDGKSVNLTSQGGGEGAKTGLYAVPVNTTKAGVAEPVSAETEIVPFVENKLDKAVEKFGHIPEMWNPYNNAEISDKAPTLTTQCGSQTNSSTVFVTSSICYAIPIEWDEDGKPIKAISGADGKEYTVYEVKDGLITIKGKQYPIKLEDGFYIIRKLTVRECMRLQTVPEWYEFPVSDTQAYKMLGNGWTVEVIKWLIGFTLE